MNAVDRNEIYRQQARELLGDAMFEHCRQVALDAPAPTSEQLATVGRIFGPGVRRIACDLAQEPALPLAA